MCNLINTNQLLTTAINIVVKSHGGWKNVDKFATNLHLGKIFPSNPRDQSMDGKILPRWRFVANLSTFFQPP
jgi:hypothetical protein